MVKRGPNKARGSGSSTHADEADTSLSSAVGERPSIEVRILEINPNGKLEELSCYPLSYYGSCPNVGDTIIDNGPSGTGFYAIEQRYFVKETILHAGWAVIVREIDPSGAPQDLWDEWISATEFWDDVDDRKTAGNNRSVEAKIKSALKKPAETRSSHKPKPTTKRKKT